ncbi:Gfo/Idh/MocA family oxidoreductase [Halobacteria archaeon AArc-curdl1]|uniref:Gfo/Idh/MocA family oxidoreductase n=1 Tax=Natronosalvus hydrolyticus TaxID=2979988 RepID=A0AAP3E5X8_9EURY|nr:Gfo/Idh/MocA family oxidoreductase [Halobacteria archaeon AArc-curdl1]
MPPLLIGIVGAGNIGRIHARAIESLGESITAVADIDPASRESFANEFDVASTYDDYRTMLDAEPLDLVIVAVPNSLHAECAIAVLEADVDAFVEKPLAHTLEDAERLAAVEAESAGRVFVGFVRAFEPWVDEIRSAIDAGELGEVYDIDATFVRRRGIPQLGSWFTRKDVSGGGAVIDIGVHVVHLALHLLDFPEVETVSAMTGSHFGSKAEYTYLNMWGGAPVDDGAFDVDDYARALVRTADGVTLHLHLAWASNGESNQSLRIYGDRAGATIDGAGSTQRATLYSTRGDGLTDTELHLPDSDRFNEQWEYVLAVTRGDVEPSHNTLEEGLAVQRVVDAIYESAETKREVVLTE